MNDMYLITLSGGGDIQYHLLRKEIWDWVFSPIPNFTSGMMVDTTAPDIVKQNAFKMGACGDWVTKWEEFEVIITKGSCVNDRMLRAYDYFNNDPCTFYSNKDLMKFVKDNDINIVEETNGCIY